MQVSEVRIVAGQSQLASAHKIVNLRFDHQDMDGDDEHDVDDGDLDEDDCDDQDDNQNEAHLAITKHRVASNSKLRSTSCCRWGWKFDDVKDWSEDKKNFLNKTNYEIDETSPSIFDAP